MAKNKKTQAQRVQECINLKKGLIELDMDHLPEFIELYDIMNEYIKDGIPKSGRISIDSAKRVAIYKFNTDPFIPCDITLKVV